MTQPVVLDVELLELVDMVLVVNVDEDEVVVDVDVDEVVE